MPVRGVRGATTVTEDDSEQILLETRRLLALMVRKNGIDVEDIADIMFTTTSDLRASFPAEAARQLGWDHVPLICAQEIDVPGSRGKCIRVLLHWNTDAPPERIHHIYANDTQDLRKPPTNLSEQQRRDVERWVEEQL